MMRLTNRQGLIICLVALVFFLLPPVQAQPGPGPGGGGGGPGDPPRSTPGLAPVILAGMAAAGYLGKRFLGKSDQEE